MRLVNQAQGCCYASSACAPKTWSNRFDDRRDCGVISRVRANGGRFGEAVVSPARRRGPESNRLTGAAGWLDARPEAHRIPATGESAPTGAPRFHRRKIRNGSLARLDGKTGMSKRSLKTSFVVNLFAPTVRLAIGMVTIPIFLRHVGDARFGVISIGWLLLGYFGFLDLGLSRATTNALAKLREAPQHERARVLLTTMVLNLGFGLIGGFVLFIVGGYLLEHFVSIPDALRPEVVWSFPWLTCLLPMSLLSGAAIGALESRERFLLANSLQILGVTLTQIVSVVVAVFVSPSLKVIIPAIAIADAASIVVILAAVHRIEGPFSLRSFDRREARTLLGYGGWVSVSNLIAPILVAADQFLIGSVIGVAAVAHYAVPMNLVTRSQIFPAALGRTFFPRMSSSTGDEARELAVRALSALGFGFAAVCAPAIILSPTFFRYWIGADFATFAAPVAQILFLGAWINGLAFLAFHLMQSQGRPDLTGKLHIAEVAPFLAILWVLTAKLGINGAAIAWSLRCAVDAFAMFWGAGILRNGVLSALRPAFLLGASGVGAHFIGFNLALALSAAVVVGVISMALAYAFSEDWRHLFDTVSVRGRELADHAIRRIKPTQGADPKTLQ